MQEVHKMPARYAVKVSLVFVAWSEELHAHHSKYEDNNDKHEAQVAQGPHGPADDANQEVECGPRFGKLEDTQLEEETWGQSLAYHSHTNPAYDNCFNVKALNFANFANELFPQN